MANLFRNFLNKAYNLFRKTEIAEYREARLGRDIVLEAYNRGLRCRDGGKETLLRYKIGLMKSVDSILTQLYKDVNSLNNPMPKRVRIEQKICRLEELFLGAV